MVKKKGSREMNPADAHRYVLRQNCRIWYCTQARIDSIEQLTLESVREHLQAYQSVDVYLTSTRRNGRKWQTRP